MAEAKKIVHILYSGLGGHGNVFLSMVDADREKRYRYGGIFVGIEPMKEEYKVRCAERGISYAAILKKRGLDIKAFYRVYKNIKREKPNIVFLHSGTNILPAVAYRLFGGVSNVKVIVRETEANHLKVKQDWFWLYVSMILATRIFFLSEQYKEDVQKRLGSFFKRKKTGVIPNGIDLDIFSPRTNFSSGDRPLKLGMQSRLERSKDHDTLIRAFARLKNKPYYHRISLHLAGDGSKRQELEALSGELQMNDKIQFHGMLHEKDLIDFLRSLDIYIHASIGETMSTAIMQAMACRLPVIASDVKGINNMVFNSFNGLTIPAKNEVALAAAIDKLILDEVQREKLASAAYTYARDKFSNERMLRSYIEAFEA